MKSRKEYAKRRQQRQEKRQLYEKMGRSPTKEEIKKESLTSVQKKYSTYQKQQKEAAKVAKSKAKYQRQKELQNQKKKFLEDSGYTGKITTKLLRQSWENIKKLIDDSEKTYKAKWYLVIYFGDRTNSFDVIRYAGFYNNMTSKECQNNINHTLHEKGEVGSSGFPGHVLVRRYSSRYIMENDILEKQQLGYYVVAAGNEWTLTGIMRATAFALDMCTEGNRQTVLDAIKNYVKEDIPELYKYFYF
uniref:Uncharacterized protein n=1 Tax=Tectiviridae sp. cthzn51 TaxID=2826821 RepID=A0A8S5LUZ9_9VIRU|nr:MAG TPA: hypothetical protein [Tectiviridae sp. cthzn51]